MLAQIETLSIIFCLTNVIFSTTIIILNEYSINSKLKNIIIGIILFIISFCLLYFAININIILFIVVFLLLFSIPIMCLYLFVLINNDYIPRYNNPYIESDSESDISPTIKLHDGV